MIAALMLMHQEAVRQARRESGVSPELVAELRQQAQQMKAQSDAVHRLDAEHPPFRLAIAYNVFQYDSDATLASAFFDLFSGNHDAESHWHWRFHKTVQVFRSPNNLCLEQELLRAANLTLVGDDVDEKDIPSAQKSSRCPSRNRMHVDGRR